MASKKYIVGDKGYVRKAGKVYQTGQEITLTEKEFGNCKEYVVEKDSKEGKILVAVREDQDQKGEEQDQAPEQDKDTK